VSVSTYQSNSLNSDLKKFLESVAEVVKDYLKKPLPPSGFAPPVKVYFFVICFDFMHSGEYNVFDVTLSVSPHWAG
jgi:hypothetical protein